MGDLYLNENLKTDIVISMFDWKEEKHVAERPRERERTCRPRSVCRTGASRRVLHSHSLVAACDPTGESIHSKGLSRLRVNSVLLAAASSPFRSLAHECRPANHRRGRIML